MTPRPEDDWRRIHVASAAATGALRAALADPDRAQRALLARILRANAATAFGRAHGFARIDSYETYRTQVPVRGHDGFAAEIDAMAAGAANRLMAETVVAFERTGGTASGGKLVPFGAAGLDAFASAALPMLHDLVTRVPAVTRGRIYAAISPATRAPETTAGGLPVGLGSDAAYLGALAAPFGRLLAVPPELGAIPEVGRWRRETLAHLLEADDLSFVTVWSPSFFTALIEALPGAAGALMPRLSAAAGARLDAWLAAPGAGTGVLWPRLAAISCWTDAGSAPFARRLAALCPQAEILPKGVIATEAPVTVPLGAGHGAVPALTSTVIEFRDPATGTCRLAGDLTPGALYDAILTTPSGLYRYDIGDRLRCLATGPDGPRLAFEGRAGVVSDMVGEKLDEGFVARVLAGLPGLDGPARLEARDGDPPQYRLMLAPGTAPPDADALDRALGRNPQYGYARAIGQLGPPAIDRGTVDPAAEAEAGARAGRRLGDAKPAVLVPLPTPRPRRD